MYLSQCSHSAPNKSQSVETATSESRLTPWGIPNRLSSNAVWVWHDSYNLPSPLWQRITQSRSRTSKPEQQMRTKVCRRSTRFKTAIWALGETSSELHTSFVLGQPSPLAGSLSTANVMENDDDQEERRRLDDHKLKRLVLYYFPATSESPTRSHIIWISNVKVVYGAEMTVNLKENNEVEDLIARTKSTYIQKIYFHSGMTKRRLAFLV